MQRLLSGLLGICAAFIAPACSKHADKSKPNVVVIVLDSVRPDYLSAYENPKPTSPFLARFAAKATRYDEARTIDPGELQLLSAPSGQAEARKK